MGRARNTVRTLDAGATGTERVIKRSNGNKKATSNANVGMNAALLIASSRSNSWVVCGLADSGHELPKRL